QEGREDLRLALGRSLFENALQVVIDGMRADTEGFGDFLGIGDVADERDNDVGLAPAELRGRSEAFDLFCEDQWGVALFDRFRPGHRLPACSVANLLISSYSARRRNANSKR